MVCSNGGTYTNPLIICNNDFAISLIIQVELTPQNLKDYVIGQQALITSETVIKACSIIKNMEDYYTKKKCFKTLKYRNYQQYIRRQYCLKLMISLHFFYYNSKWYPV